MKTNKLLFLFFVVNQMIFAESEKESTLKFLRSNNDMYQTMHKKYIFNSHRADLIQGEVQKYFIVIKEINLTTNKIDIKSLTELIFEGIRNAQLKTYEDEQLTQGMTIFNVYENMVMPQNPELGTKQKKKYFDLADVSLIEIVANYVKSTRYPEPVFDNLLIKLKIPGDMYDIGVPKTICILDYDELIKFLRHKRFKVKINNVDILIANAIDNNMLTFVYLFINNMDVNDKYKISDKDAKQNNNIAKELLNKEIENIF